MPRRSDTLLGKRKERFCPLCAPETKLIARSEWIRHNVLSNHRVRWCPGAESNHRHCDFQSHALPTELPGRLAPSRRSGWRLIGAGLRLVQRERGTISRGAALLRTPSASASRHQYAAVETAMHRAATYGRSRVHARLVVASLPPSRGSPRSWRASGRGRPADVAPSSYPALGPAQRTSTPDPWAGLYVGAGVSAWGGKGVKGGFGGESYFGYDHVFDNGVILGVRASTGYVPVSLVDPRVHPVHRNRFRRRRSHRRLPDVGQVTPYVIAGVDFARPTQFRRRSSPPDAINNVFSGPGAVQAVGTVGIGVNLPDHARISAWASRRSSILQHRQRPFAPWPYALAGARVACRAGLRRPPQPE